jgi:hypothetical protein
MMHGTDHYHRYPIGNLLLTDSIIMFCEDHKAWWVMDVIGSYAPYEQPFLVMTMDVEDEKATFTVREDSDRPIIIEQHIDYTDLDVSIRLFFTDGVLMFPSDY